MPVSVISVKWCQMSFDTWTGDRCHIPLGYDTDTKATIRHVLSRMSCDTKLQTTQRNGTTGRTTGTLARHPCQDTTAKPKRRLGPNACQIEASKAKVRKARESNKTENE